MRILKISLLIAAALLASSAGALWVSHPRPTQNFANVTIKNNSFIVEVAADDATRIQGLSYRQTLASSGGMLFIFDEPARHAFWMKNMKFPLDILWIRGGSVVDMEENVPPPVLGASDDLLTRYEPDVSAEMVLEVGAGTAARYGVRIGDRVVIARNPIQARAVSRFSPERMAADIERTVTRFIRISYRAEDYFIETLRQAPPRGSEFTIKKLLARTNAYQKFFIEYRSAGRVVSGVMNVPLGTAPSQGFPVLILNHGLIHRSIYFSGRGSKREQDFFTRHGYVTIHPDYRGLGSSDPDFSSHHDFYVGYTEDVIALIDALKILKPKLLDVERIGMWGHSMGGGIAARVMALRPDIRAFVLFAPISADVEDNFYELSDKEIEWLRKTYGPEGDEVYKKMSPRAYFADVGAPVQLHHGTGDRDVPISFSEKMFETLTRHGKKVEFFKYTGEKHEFADVWQLAAERALMFFDRYVKKGL